MNGALSGSASETRPVVYDPSATGDLYLGQSGAGAEYFKGLLDEVRVYPRAVSDEEIGKLALLRPPDGAWINLLPLIDPGKDGVRGTWTRQQGSLVSDTSQFSRIEIPYQPPDEYDFRITFTQLEPTSSPEAGGDAVQVFPFSGRSVTWQLGGYENRVFGFAPTRPDPIPKSQILVERSLVSFPAYRPAEGFVHEVDVLEPHFAARGRPLNRPFGAAVVGVDDDGGRSDAPPQGRRDEVQRERPVARGIILNRPR